VVNLHATCSEGIPCVCGHPTLIAESQYIFVQGHWDWVENRPVERTSERSKLVLTV